MPVGARSGGMADACIAYADEAAAIYHNPAKVAFFRTIYSDVSLGWEGFPLYENWSVMYGKPTADASYFGLGMVRRKYNIGERPYWSFQLMIPSTMRISDNCAAGINLKYAAQKAGSSDFNTTFTSDFGFYYGSGAFGYAFTLQNFIDPKMRSFPLRYNSGIALKTELFIFEIDVFSDSAEELFSDLDGIRAGGELAFTKYAFRGGYIKEEGIEYYTAGIGVYSLFKIYSFGYAYRAQADDLINGTHWFSYTYAAI